MQSSTRFSQDFLASKFHFCPSVSKYKYLSPWTKIYFPTSRRQLSSQLIGKPGFSFCPSFSSICFRSNLVSKAFITWHILRPGLNSSIYILHAPRSRASEENDFLKGAPKHLSSPQAILLNAAAQRWAGSDKYP